MQDCADDEDESCKKTIVVTPQPIISTNESKYHFCGSRNKLMVNNLKNSDRFFVRIRLRIGFLYII